MLPVFMIGTQRSGSNLLRLMINQLDRVVSPHPPHILERMMPLMHLYGDLDKTSNFDALVDDVCKLIELNPVEWAGIELDRSVVAKKCKDNTLMSVYQAVYELYAERTNANAWCCKSLSNINYVREIEEHFISPRYIYLYRDGRDVALSFQKAVVGEKHIYSIAREWAETQRKALDLRERIEASRFFCISYEELISDQESAARKLCAFLDCEYDEGMLSFYASKDAASAARSSDLWKNLDQPLIKSNCGKYKREMPRNDIEIFESVAGDALQQLGYEREYIAAGQELVFNASDIEIFDEVNRRMKFQVLKSLDKDDRNRREMQSALLRKIKSERVA